MAGWMWPGVTQTKLIQFHIALACRSFHSHFCPQPPWYSDLLPVMNARMQGRKISSPLSCPTDTYWCDKVWISLWHHHYHHCICKKWYCNFHHYVDIIPPSDSSSRWTKNVWQAEKCSIRSRKEKKRHNPISKQSTVTRFNFEVKTHFFLHWLCQQTLIFIYFDY